MAAGIGRWPIGVKRMCLVLGVVGAIVAMFVAAPVVSAKGSASVGSRLEGLAGSSAGRRADRALTAAVPAGEVARASHDLLVQDGSRLTSFETGLLKIATIIGAPKNQAVLSAVSQGRRLSPSQIRTLSRLLVSVGDSPAIKLLVKKGRALRRNPTTLASYLTTDAATPGAVPAELPSTGSAALDRIDAQLARAERSASVTSLGARLRKVLARPGAARYLSTLPPLFVASLIPAQTLETYALPAEGDALAWRFTQAPVANPYLTARQNAALRNGLDLDVNAVREVTNDAAKELSKRVGLTGVAEAIAVFLVGEPVVIGGATVYAVYDAVSGVIEVVENLAQYLHDLYQADHPIGLALLPGADVSMIAGVGTLFVVEDSTPDCPLCGTEPNATVSIGPNGGPCPAHVCTATVAGPDGVTARMGDAITSIPVTVLPGALQNMTLSPSSATAPQGIGTTFVVTGSDKYKNPVDVSNATFSIDPGEPNGWCQGAICGGNTPGAYTVTAKSGSVTRSATLTVTGVPARLRITPGPGQWLVGTHHDFLVEELDANGNPIRTLGGSGAQVVVTLDSNEASDGSCDDLGCTANSPGPHHVTATYQDPDTGQTLTGSLEIAVVGPNSTWTATQAPLPANANPSTPDATVSSMACSTSNCVALGRYYNTANASVTAFWTESGGTWSVVEPPLPANAASAPGLSIQSVACSSSNCIAWGTYTNNIGPNDTEVGLWSESGGTWTATEAPAPSNIRSGSYAQGLNSGACSATTCVVTGQYLDTDAAQQDPAAWTESAAGQWTVSELPEPSGSFPYGVYGGGPVVCSPSMCVAYSYYEFPTQGSGAYAGVLWTNAGGGWAAAATPFPADIADPAPGMHETTVDSVVCFIDACYAHGSYINNGGGISQTYWSSSDGNWTVTTPPTASNGGTADPLTNASSTACSSDACLGVGTGVLWAEMGGTWTSSAPLTPANASATNPDLAISHATGCFAHACLGTGSYNDAFGDRNAVLWLDSDGTWTATEAPLPAGSVGSQTTTINSVACSATVCVASGNYVGNVGSGLALWTDTINSS